ncbi:aldehyde dehydrogenase family protein [Aeromicrobium sp. UC242_57]|uniref:aldehyde dehydrogenase family protein n=1 Tax=Aeromicrobium sp. UC242_57 TaxID=3374624 RepID=UPI003794C03E
MTDIATRTLEIFDRLGAGDPFVADGDLVCRSPIDGSELGRLRSHTADDVHDVIGQAQTAFEQWRTVPAPVRGQFVRELGRACCASTRTISGRWCRSRPARSSRRGSARSRR